MPKSSENPKQPATPEGEPAPTGTQDGSPDTTALLQRYGISTVPRPTYEWGGYRYTNAHDAIAAAKRGGAA